LKSKVIKNKAQPLGKYPHLKRAGDFIYVSGVSSRRPDDTHIGAVQKDDGSWQLDIRLQTEAVIQHIEALLGTMEASLSDIIDITTFLVDMKDFDGYNEVYGKFLDYTGPTGTTVAVHQLPHPNLLIEIKAIAYKPA